jgi:putative SOS response-associated peptidase YedK
MAAIHPRMPVIVAEHLRRDWLANEGVQADRMIATVLAHPDPTLIVGPVELERRAPPPMEADQLTLF